MAHIGRTGRTCQHAAQVSEEVTVLRSPKDVDEVVIVLSSECVGLRDDKITDL